MNSSISFQVKGASQIGRQRFQSQTLAESCKHFKAVHFSGIKIGSMQALLHKIYDLNSGMPQNGFKLEAVDGMATFGSIFNKPVEGHEDSLEIKYNPIMDEILIMRWSTFTPLKSNKPTTIGIAYSLTGYIKQFVD